jgi:ribosome maturation factor RimP
MSGHPGDTQSEARRLEEYLEPTVASHNLHLEAVEVRTAGEHRTVHVVVDLFEGTGSVDLDAIAEVSRSLSEAMDRDPHDSGRAPYDLEVSSPGVGRPLTEPRHWRRNVGRLVKVNLMGEENIAGRLLEATDEGIVVVPDLPVKKGMKPKQCEPLHLEFSRIRRGTVDVDFSRPDDPDRDPLEIDDEAEEA